MAREWALAGVSEEELKASTPLKPPETPKGKWENFWYHYKWVTLLVAFAVIVCTILFVQMLLRDDPDYRLPLVTDERMSEGQIAALQAELIKYGEDLDGDGKVEIQIENWFLNPKETDALMQSVRNNMQNMTAHLAAGDRLFFIFDQNTYNDRIRSLFEEGKSFYAPVELAVDGLAENGVCWDWYGTALQQSDAMKELPAHLYFGVRATSGSTAGKTEEFAQEMRLLHAFVKGQQPAATE